MLSCSTKHWYSKSVTLNFTVGDSHLPAHSHLKQSKNTGSSVSPGEMQDHYDKVSNKVQLIWIKIACVEKKKEYIKSNWFYKSMLLGD